MASSETLLKLIQDIYSHRIRTIISTL